MIGHPDANSTGVTPACDLYSSPPGVLDEAKAANPKWAGEIYSQVSQMVVMGSSLTIDCSIGD